MKFPPFKLKNVQLRILAIAVIYLMNLFLILELTADRVPILGFHSIIDVQNPNQKEIQGSTLPSMDYTKQNLAEFLDYLVSHNFWFLTAQDLYDYFITKSKPMPPEHIGQKPIMISFDDSYKTVYTNLLPVLEDLSKKYDRQVKVVLFVNPGNFAKKESKTAYNLTCNNLREGLKKGFYDIQSHGENHKKLTDLDTDHLIYELAEAQTRLRKCTQGLDPNHTVASHIAYPNGAVNSKVEEYAAKYYLSGFLYNSKILKLGWWLRSNYRIPRLSVNHQKTPERLIQMAERALIIKN